ncbi:hypothetical protein ACHAPQ_011032, partial [Fusarium lateritium]
MLAPAAYSAFTGASQGDFNTDLNNLSVVNTNTVTWGSVELQKGKSPVSLSVAPNDFSIAIGYLNIALSVVGLASTVASKIATKAAEGAAEDAGQLTADASAQDIQAAFKKILSDPQTRKNFVEQAGDDGAKMLENTT